MSESRALVSLIVVVALLAYSGVLVVLATRRARTLVWWLLLTTTAFDLIRTAGWLGLVLWERPEWYDAIPRFGWLILASQALAAGALLWLSRYILGGDEPHHGGR